MTRAIIIEGDTGTDTAAAIRALLTARGSSASVTVSLRSKPLIGDIKRWVAFQTGVAECVIVDPIRTPGAVRARRAVVWGARTILGRKLTEIGIALGGRDPSTIRHALMCAQAMAISDPAFRMLTTRMTSTFAGDLA